MCLVPLGTSPITGPGMNPTRPAGKSAAEIIPVVGSGAVAEGAAFGVESIYTHRHKMYLSLCERKRRSAESALTVLRALKYSMIGELYHRSRNPPECVNQDTWPPPCVVAKTTRFVLATPSKGMFFPARRGSSVECMLRRGIPIVSRYFQSVNPGTSTPSERGLRL